MVRTVHPLHIRTLGGNFARAALPNISTRGRVGEFNTPIRSRLWRFTHRKPQISDIATLFSHIDVYGQALSRMQQAVTR